MRCIYCKRENDARGREHVYPEGLGQHGWMLPRGAVCDTCNGRALRRLDSALIEHPHISMVLSVYGIAGKNGRPRKRLGHFERDANDKLALRPPARCMREVHVDQERILVQTDPPSTFRDDLFCRGLFKIAFNVLAAVEGTAFVLEPEFDAVRQFVVQPATREDRMPYLQRILHRGGDLPETVAAPSFGRINQRRFEVVCMTIFVDEFYVDLLRPHQVVDIIDAMQPAHERARVLVHDAHGRVCRPDGSVIPPLTFDAAPSLLAELLHAPLTDQSPLFAHGESARREHPTGIADESLPESVDS